MGIGLFYLREMTQIKESLICGKPTIARLKRLAADMDKALCLKLMAFLSDKMKEEGHPPDPNELGRRYSRIERSRICPLWDVCSNYAKVLEKYGAIQLELSL